MILSEEEARELSALTWAARELVEMLADITQQHARQDTHARRIVAALDAWRTARGWSPEGFGNELGVDEAPLHRLGGVRPLKADDYAAGWFGFCACGYSTDVGIKDDAWCAIAEHFAKAVFSVTRGST